MKLVPVGSCLAALLPVLAAPPQASARQVFKSEMICSDPAVTGSASVDARRVEGGFAVRLKMKLTGAPPNANLTCEFECDGFYGFSYPCPANAKGRVKAQGERVDITTSPFRCDMLGVNVSGDLVCEVGFDFTP